MARIIQTKNKADIVTGFDLKCDINIYQTLKEEFDDIGGLFFELFGDALARVMAKDNEAAAVRWLNKRVEAAEEIFLQEASLSRWSGNMVDNSVVGVSGVMPEMRGDTLYMDLRIGVNHKAIMNPANWQSHKNKFYGKSKRFVNPIIYTYNGKRMKPGVDYSMWLEDGTARIPNAALWEGFVERAEERFWA